MTAVRQLRVRNWPLSSAFSLARPEDLSRNVRDGLCGTGVQDPEHILQSCSTLAPEWIRLWPSGAALKEGLW